MSLHYANKLLEQGKLYCKDSMIRTMFYNTTRIDLRKKGILWQNGDENSTFHFGLLPKPYTRITQLIPIKGDPIFKGDTIKFYLGGATSVSNDGNRSGFPNIKGSRVTIWKINGENFQIGQMNNVTYKGIFEGYEHSHNFSVTAERVSQTQIKYTTSFQNYYGMRVALPCFKIELV